MPSHRRSTRQEHEAFLIAQVTWNSWAAPKRRLPSIPTLCGMGAILFLLLLVYL